MKRLVQWLMLGTICLAIVSFAVAQGGTGKAKSNSKQLPAEVCKAIEQFIAQIDSARSVKEKAAREAKFAKAQDELAMVLKRNDKLALLSEASAYIRYTELVVSGDAKDANLDELLQKRLETRSGLLGLCTSYTTTR